MKGILQTATVNLFKTISIWMGNVLPKPPATTCGATNHSSPKETLDFRESILFPKWSTDNKQLIMNKTPNSHETQSTQGYRVRLPALYLPRTNPCFEKAVDCKCSQSIIFIGFCQEFWAGLGRIPNPFPPSAPARSWIARDPFSRMSKMRSERWN